MECQHCFEGCSNVFVVPNDYMESWMFFLKGFLKLGSLFLLESCKTQILPGSILIVNLVI